MTLHVLRDRLTVDEAANLASQLPILLIGFYYEDWKPARNHSKERSQEEFLAHIRDYFSNIDPNIDAEQVVRAVFRLLCERVTKGEIENVARMMPPELRELWPEQVRA